MSTCRTDAVFTGYSNLYVVTLLSNLGGKNVSLSVLWSVAWLNGVLEY